MTRGDFFFGWMGRNLLDGFRRWRWMMGANWDGMDEMAWGWMGIL